MLMEMVIPHQPKVSVDSGADAFASDATQWGDFDEDGFGETMKRFMD